MEWLIFFLAVGVISSVGGWLLLAGKKRRALSWPMVSGQFEQGEIRATDTGWIADLSYSYQVNGESFAGFYEISFPMRRFAEEFIAMTQGQPVLVRYDPEKPEDSVIRDQDNAALLALR